MTGPGRSYAGLCISFLCVSDSIELGNPIFPAHVPRADRKTGKIRCFYILPVDGQLVIMRKHVTGLKLYRLLGACLSSQ